MADFATTVPSGKGPTRRMLQSACNVDNVNNSIRLQSYFNTARQLMLQAEIYRTEQQLETAYVYLKRFMQLALYVIPNHNDFGNRVYSKEKLWLQREKRRMLEMLEMVSLQLDQMDAAYAAATAPAPPAPAQGDWWDEIPEAPTGSVGNRPALPPSAPSISLEDIPEAPGGPGSNAAAIVPSAPAPPEMHDWGLHHGGGGVGGTGTRGLPRESSGRRGDIGLSDMLQKLSVDTGGNTVTSYPDVRKPHHMQEVSSKRVGERKTVSFDIKRKLILPSSLVAHFEQIARPNTLKPPDGIETCGILAGQLVGNTLQMTSLIIPKQVGKPDYCESKDETEVFNFMEANRLITLGWIHTHPAQNCFLSSVDLHTQWGYQLQLPEAVAIVYAPRDGKKRFGVFRLTEPHGMKLIQECKMTGFHTHPDDVVIYEDCVPAWSDERHFTVKDLR